MTAPLVWLMDGTNPPATQYPAPSNPLPRKHTDMTTVHVNPFGTRRIDVFFNKVDFEGLEFRLTKAKRDSMIALLCAVPQSNIYVIAPDEPSTVVQVVYYGGMTDNAETVSDVNGMYIVKFSLYKK